MVGDTGFEPV